MSDVYPEVYGEVYGAGGGLVGLVLGVTAELYTGSWTDITGYLYQRQPATIQLGRQDESSQISPASCSMLLNNRTGIFTTRSPTGELYGTIGQNTPFRLSVPNYLAGGGTYLRFADDATSYAAGPSTGFVEIAGEIDIRVDMQLDSYAPCVLASRWSSATNGLDQSWAFVLNGDGTLSFTWNDGSAYQTATSAVPLPYLGRVMVRCDFSPGATEAVFWTAPDMAGTQTQLGATVTIANDDAIDAPGVPVTVGWSEYATYASEPGAAVGGLLGQVYEMQLLGNGTMVSDMVFSAQTVGATSFNDDQSNAWTLNGSAAINDRCYRFHGEMAAWPKAADPSSRDAYSQATASGVLRRLQQGTPNAPSAMRRAISSGETGQTATAFWPGEDPQGSAQIASGLAGGTPMLVSGQPSYQGTAGSASADTNFACSAQLVQIASSVWYGALPSYTPGANTEQLTFLLCLPSGGAGSAVLMRISMAGGHTIDVVASASGSGTLEVNVDGSLSFTGPTGLNGVPVLVQVGPGGFGSTCELFVLPLGPAAVPSGFSGVSDTGTTWTRVQVNPTAANFGGTSLGGIWFTPAGTGLTGLQNPLNAWSGETAGRRTLRLAAENGLNARVYGFPDRSVVMGAQAIDTIANLFEDIEQTDMGMLYEPREATGIGYRTSRSMCNQAAAATADYSQQQVSQGFADTADDLLTLNDVIVSNADGSSVEVSLTVGAMSVQDPPNGIGPVSNSLDVYPESDSFLPHLGGWALHVRSVDEDRYPSIPFQMARITTPQDVLLLRIGDYLQITNTPYWIPPGPVKQLCAGFQETFGPSIVWPVMINGVPESPYEVMTFGTDAADSSHFDTAGSELASPATSTAASLSVATTAGPLWTTSGADFPFDINIAGERITVTDITGSSSPQTFAVTRSVNGVVKAQAEDAAVTLWTTPVWALV
jgi:hypothetical protein